jgi:nitrite reductase/ring-hydroxylating ferredoxin subunit
MDRVFACTDSEMEKGSARMVEAAGVRVALFRNSDGEFYATSDSCTHEQWSLGEDGDLEENEVVCPLHLARFDIRTGEALCVPAIDPLASYQVEIDEDDNVYVIVDPR